MRELERVTRHTREGGGGGGGSEGSVRKRETCSLVFAARKRSIVTFSIEYDDSPTIIDFIFPRSTPLGPRHRGSPALKKNNPAIK